MKKAIGITLDTHTDALPGSEVVNIVQKIESLGYESVWLTDAMAREPFAMVCHLLANTNGLKVGTAIANMYGRDAMTAAQVRRTLSELYPGRFLMGLGVSIPFMNDVRHAKTISPLVKQSAYLDQMKSFSLVSAAPKELAPVYTAGHGPKLQALGMEKADGLMTWVMPPQHIEVTRKRVGAEKEVNSHVPVVLSTDADAARKTGREYLALWLALPHYQKAWMTAGFEESDFADGGSDRLIDSIVAWGDAAAIAEHIDRFYDAGATRTILEPMKLSGDAHTHGTVADMHVEADWDALTEIASYL